MFLCWLLELNTLSSILVLYCFKDTPGNRLICIVVCTRTSLRVCYANASVTVTITIRSSLSVSVTTCLIKPGNVRNLMENALS